MTELAIEVKGLRKSYGNFEAVRGVDLHVNQGEVFSLLGPNGAGKTTTVEILEGYRSRSGGDVSVLGSDPAKTDPKWKARIGIVLQETGVNRFLTVAETIEQFRGFFPHPRPLDEIVEVVGLADKRDALVRRLSGGQQRRLDVAVGLAGDPDLLFLDEPTTGFDPSARRNAWQMVNNLRDLGKTILLTTHYMDEAQHLADRIAVIVDGQIVAEGSPEALISGDSDKSTIAFALDPNAPSLPQDIASSAHIEGHSIRIETTDAMRTLNRLTGWAIENGTELQGLSVSRATLEDVYLRLTATAERKEEQPESAPTRRKRGRR